jgi:hypothetical protein
LIISLFTGYDARFVTVKTNNDVFSNFGKSEPVTFSQISTNMDEVSRLQPDVTKTTLSLKQDLLDRSFKTIVEVSLAALNVFELFWPKNKQVS